jgi:hypothetical protein
MMVLSNCKGPFIQGLDDLCNLATFRLLLAKSQEDNIFKAIFKNQTKKIANESVLQYGYPDTLTIAFWTIRAIIEPFGSSVRSSP